MNYAAVGKAVIDCIEQLVAAGASRETVELHIQPLEVAAIQSILDNQRDQLLLNLEISSSYLAGRFGVDERTIRNWRKSALDRKVSSALISA